MSPLASTSAVLFLGLLSLQCLRSWTLIISRTPFSRVGEEKCRMPCMMSNMQLASDTPKGFTYTPKRFSYCQKLQSQRACENAYLWQAFNKNHSGGGTIKPCHWHGDDCDTHKDGRDWIHSCPVEPASLLCVQPGERSWGPEPWPLSNEDARDPSYPSFNKTASFNKATGSPGTGRLPWQSGHSDHSNYPYTIQCGGKTLSLSHASIVLRNPANGKLATWCPNAKIGTSTMSAAIATILLGKSINQYTDMKHAHQFVEKGMTVKDYVNNGKGQELCNMEMSFTFIRNPWDRLISAYLDKVATRKLIVPGFHNATFPQLINALKEVDPLQMNGHFTPVSTRCLTGTLDYTKAYKIEDDFENSIAEIFSSLGVSRERTLTVLKKVGSQNQNTQHRAGLRQRLDMFHRTEGLADIVARIYAEDIEFGDYAFNKTG